ncbi:MAG TPA: hypothetical protein VMY77_11015 [Chitinophagaceae bacterium]|nr:hypothetical protein [Chitinophagaceae bacterium]
MMAISILLIGICLRLLIEIVAMIIKNAARSKYRIKNVNGLFVNNYIDSKVFFVSRFKALANISFIRDVDVTKAYAFIMENFAAEVVEVYQYSSFDYAENKALFIMTIFVLRDNRMIELGYDYAEVLFTNDHYSWANELLASLSNCRMAERTKVMGFVRPEAITEN